jgi:hypothetical protein
MNTWEIDELLDAMRQLKDHLAAAPDPGLRTDRSDWLVTWHRLHVQALHLCAEVLPDVGEAHRAIIRAEIARIRALLQRRGQRVAAVTAAPNN